MAKRYRYGLVVGKFAPPHRGHQFLIDAARAECEQVIALVWSCPDFAGMTSERRAEWLRELYPDLTVVVPPNAPRNDAPGPVHWEYIRNILRVRGIPVEAVFTSEGYGSEFAASLGAAHRLVDADRRAIPISGQAVRADPHRWREYLDPRIYRHFVRSVVFLGAESTGKSTLAERMAAEYQTVWVPEYGREAFERAEGTLQPHHLLEIARVQHEREEQALLKANRYLFCDTNALTTLIYAFLLGRQAASELFERAAECKTRYSHTFVCDDDFAFVQDGWRAHSSVQTVQQAFVLFDLATRGISYMVVSGSMEQRVAFVRHALDQAVKEREDARVQDAG
jgi:HTH-type transcriptional repressor of NAD biosynthesis genes